MLEGSGPGWDTHRSEARAASEDVPHPANFLPPAAVAELVDAQASGACVLRDVEVRVLSAASRCWPHPAQEAGRESARIVRFLDQPLPTAATASPSPPRCARPPTGCGRRASASRRR